MKDALLLVDLINRFDHDDGERLLEHYRAAVPAICRALDHARSSGIPVVYANDVEGPWTSDAPGLVRAAIEEGRGGDAVAVVAPQAGETFVVKPRYSAFDHTALSLILEELEVERVVMAGAALERCVLQSAIDGRELGFKTTILEDACVHVDRDLEQVALTYAERILGAQVVSTEDWVSGS
jgi:nicotinamidase-related amidase